MPPRPMPPHTQTKMFNFLKHHKEEALKRCKEREEQNHEKQRIAN